MNSTGMLELFGILVALVHVLGALTAIHAVVKTRTAQGAIAWAMGLVMIPYVTLPLYWVLGRTKFHGYVDARRSGNLEINDIAQQLGTQAADYTVQLEGRESRFEALARFAKMPFTNGNRAELLVDGDATFGAMFAGIDAARDYILVQFFIVHSDRLGEELKDRLIRKAKEGVRVYLLYDEIGSHKLPRTYIADLRTAGVEVEPFRTTKGVGNRFQLNFRNHRKIVVVDGRTAYVGGLNVGDEYMGRDPRFGPWRDTHVQVEGPAVQGVQLSFVEDWHWATHQVPELNWNLQPAPGGDTKVLVLPSGPADELETCGLAFVHAIHSARHRLWIASPYFVPDLQVVCALQLAGLRGVDVRIMLPQKPDHLLVYLSAFSYLEETEPAGVKIYRYQPGFMHQKVMLVDDDLAAIGTANLDNRSFRLNFEITMLFADREFAAQVREMLERDLANCHLVKAEDLKSRPFYFQFAVRVARLMAPIQ